MSKVKGEETGLGLPVTEVEVTAEMADQITKQARKKVIDSIPEGGSIVMISQAEYGLWPVCEICLRNKSPKDSQVDPTEWHNHYEGHIS